MRSDPAQVRKVESALAALGLADRIRELPEGAATTENAAAALGVERAAIAKSLVFDADGEPLLVVISGVHLADPLKLCALTDARSVRSADPLYVRLHTGQPVGGVAPLGHPKALHTLIDVALSRQRTIWASAGHPNYVFSTTYDELLRITAGYAGEVGETPDE